MFFPLSFALPPPEMSGRPAELVRSGEERAYALQLLAAIARAGAEHSGVPCPATAEVEFLGVQPLGSAETQLPTGPNSPVAPGTPVYRERFRLRGCPPDIRIENVMVARSRSGGWWMTPYLPGDTLASPRLAQDLRQPVFATAARGLTPCQSNRPRLQMVDTEIVAPPTSLTSGWGERWRVTFCGQPRGVLIAFKPNPADGGTDFVMKLER